MLRRGERGVAHLAGARRTSRREPALQSLRVLEADGEAELGAAPQHILGAARPFGVAQILELGFKQRGHNLCAEVREATLQEQMRAYLEEAGYSEADVELGLKAGAEIVESFSAE